MLRTKDTALTEEQMGTWARAVALSGGLALISDNLALLDADARRLLDEVLVVGRASDAAACSGSTPRVPDLMDHATPTTMVADAGELAADPASGLTRVWTAPVRTDLA
jgi:hypothetical protein